MEEFPVAPLVFMHTLNNKTPHTHQAHQIHTHTHTLSLSLSFLTHHFIYIYTYIYNMSSKQNETSTETNTKKPIVCLVIGMAGSGKTTFMQVLIVLTSVFLLSPPIKSCCCCVKRTMIKTHQKQNKTSEGQCTHQRAQHTLLHDQSGPCSARCTLPGEY